MPKEFTMTRRVQFAETDLAGIMHFANYFRVMEEVEHAYFRSLGLSVAMKLEGVEIGWPRVSTQCQYFSPIKFEEELQCHLRVTEMGNASLTHEVEFTGPDQRKVAAGKTTMVCVKRDQTGFTSLRIPDLIRQKIEG